MQYQKQLLRQDFYVTYPGTVDFLPLFHKNVKSIINILIQVFIKNKGHQ